MSVYIDPLQWIRKHERRLALLDLAVLRQQAPQSEIDQLRLDIRRLKSQIRTLKRDKRKLQSVRKLTRTYFQAPPSVAAGLIDQLLGRLF